jgi:hypothetical protein
LKCAVEAVEINRSVDFNRANRYATEAASLELNWL